MFEKAANCQICLNIVNDWAIDWLTDRLIDWLTDWLIEWLLLTELKKCICISTMRILRNCFTRNKHLSLYPKRRPPQPPSLPRLSNYNLFFYKSQIVPESCCSCWDVVWKCKNHETKKAEKEGSKVIAFWLTSTAFNSLIWLRHKTATVLITLHVKKKNYYSSNFIVISFCHYLVTACKMGEFLSKLQLENYPVTVKFSLAEIHSGHCCTFLLSLS